LVTDGRCSNIGRSKIECVRQFRSAAIQLAHEFAANMPSVKTGQASRKTGQSDGAASAERNGAPRVKSRCWICLLKGWRCLVTLSNYQSSVVFWRSGSLDPVAGRQFPGLESFHRFNGRNVALFHGKRVSTGTMVGPLKVMLGNSGCSELRTQLRLPSPPVISTLGTRRTSDLLDWSH
jgi:hypothetical protein